ncbi:MAG: phosphoadenosine phosphosulfate reductase family protein [Thermoguttaceae bacterium]|nr:phosphoadenosine phosphosulfate reductase family protein [Thermoguttaceae bacterium]
MYAYTYDPETGGILLNDSTPLFSKEPRPVYAREMDILGFDQHWKYDKQDDFPYMWAESNVYWYRGVQAAKTRGGSLYVKPEIEYLSDADGKPAVPEGETLQPVDLEAMCEKNRGLLNVLEQITVKKIFDVYKRYRKKLDCFHVAFSGGKDSIVLLDLVKKALPKSSFVVVFGDTGMEFPDTYDVIDRVEVQCREEKIEFYRAASHLQPEESWRLFGPPSRVLRWCCSVHKSTPQVIKLREILGKPDYQGLAFVGVRAHESISRADYEYENYSTKQKGQYSHNAILEWSSAEIWIYMYIHDLMISEAYKYGNARVGCIFCPMSLKTDYLKNSIYSSAIAPFVEIVGENYSPENIANGYWCARKNGTALKDVSEKCIEFIENDKYIIKVQNPTTDWREWIITLGNIPFKYQVTETPSGYIVKFNPQNLKEYPKETSLFKRIFHKSAYCVGCRVCETNCRHGNISFDGNQVHISKCIHCQECNQLEGGCLVYKSLKYPSSKGESVMENNRPIDIFNSHAPKLEWFEEFFSQKDSFWDNNSLGSEQIARFSKFLHTVNLASGKKFSSFAEKLETLGWNSEISQGLLLANAAYHPQINWYIQNLQIATEYTRPDVEQKLIAYGVKEKSKSLGNIIRAFARLCDLPLGTVLNFGVVEKSGKEEYLTRTKTRISDERVILYSLYKYAEACEGYYQFSLARLMDNTVESAGVSPAQIFGLDRDEMEQFLNAASVKYPEFIHASFTHDLDKIDLREEKSSEDVLTLF